MKRILFFTLVTFIVSSVMCNAQGFEGYAAASVPDEEQVALSVKSMDFDYERAAETLVDKMKEVGLVRPPRKTLNERFSEWAMHLNVFKLLAWVITLLLLGSIAANCAATRNQKSNSDLERYYKLLEKKQDELARYVNRNIEAAINGAFEKIQKRMDAENKTLKALIEQVAINGKSTEGDKELPGGDMSDLDIIQQDIEQLLLEPRIASSLRSSGISTIGDLCNKTKSQIRRESRGIGAYSLSKIENALKEKGLNLLDEPIES